MAKAKAESRGRQMGATTLHEPEHTTTDGPWVDHAPGGGEGESTAVGPNQPLQPTRRPQVHG